MSWCTPCTKPHQDNSIQCQNRASSVLSPLIWPLFNSNTLISIYLIVIWYALTAVKTTLIKVPKKLVTWDFIVTILIDALQMIEMF